MIELLRLLNSLYQLIPVLDVRTVISDFGVENVAEAMFSHENV